MLATEVEAGPTPEPETAARDDASGLSALVAKEDAGEATAPILPQWSSPRSILCIPGSSQLDEAAALALAQILRRRGYGAIAEKADALSMSKLFSLDVSDASLICICYVERPSRARIQYAARRLIKKGHGAPVILAFLGGEPASVAEPVNGATVIQGPFKAAVEAIRDATLTVSADREAVPAVVA